ncbi:MAG: PH domain-containing protein [Actinobacteria bacterium]|nr:PH domain-containing protein [Actinomycetota bacterium]
MIDFKNPTFVKLAEVDNAVGMQMVGDFLIDDEDIFSSFKGSRDMVIFTSRRVIAVNVQGISGKKRDYSSLPYRKIQAFSVETAGTFDRDAELELWFSGLGKVRFEFNSQFDVKKFSKFIGRYIL